MWKEITIEEKRYFLECKMLNNAVNFMLYDLKQSWCENVEMPVVIARAKELNKRIQFDSLTILDTLVSGIAVETQLETTGDYDEKSEATLRVKYRIDGVPFHFKWQLVKQKEQEFQVAVTLPLFETVHGLSEQIKELLEVIAKKDKEIRQYKDDGAILRITTVATQPFNFIDFEKKYAAINEMSKGFQQIGGVLTQQIAAEKHLKEKSLEQNAEKQVQSHPEIQQQEIKKQLWNKNKKSPRSKKRKVQDMQQQRMAQKLNAKKQKLEYESSQSQSLDELLDDDLQDAQPSWMNFSSKKHVTSLSLSHSDSSLND